VSHVTEIDSASLMLYAPASALSVFECTHHGLQAAVSKDGLAQKRVQAWLNEAGPNEPSQTETGSTDSADQYFSLDDNADQSAAEADGAKQEPAKQSKRGSVRMNSAPGHSGPQSKGHRPSCSVGGPVGCRRRRAIRTRMPGTVQPSPRCRCSFANGASVPSAGAAYRPYMCSCGAHCE
jgi:hypothetical protein